MLKKITTWTRFGLLTSNLALVLMEVVAKGPAKTTEFWTVKLSESMVWEISSTRTRGRLPFDNKGNKPEKDVYLQCFSTEFQEFMPTSSSYNIYTEARTFNILRGLNNALSKR